MQTLSPRAGIALAVVGLVAWAGVAWLQADHNARVDRRIHETERGPREPAPPAGPDHPAAEAYLLTIASDGPGQSAGQVVHDALLAALRERMAPVGLNPDWGERAGGGELGTIRATLSVRTRTYSGRKPYVTHLTLPFSLEVEIEIDTAAGTGSWDGIHALEAETRLPGSIRYGSTIDSEESYARKLARAAVRQLPGRLRLD